MQAAEAALESSAEEDGGESPPPQKKSRLESVSKASDLVSSSSSSSTQGSVMHDEIHLSQSDGEKATLTNTNGAISNNKLIANGGGDDSLGDNASTILKKKLSKFDEEVVRLIGQHLHSLGLQLVSLISADIQ